VVVVTLQIGLQLLRDNGSHVVRDRDAFRFSYLRNLICHLGRHSKADVLA
jgi:hypothetical protein